MKGIIFNYLEEFTSDLAGEETWDKIIDECDLETSSGIFISPEVYPDTDLVKIVVKASELLKVDINDVIFKFGEFTVEKFWLEYPVFFENMSNSKDFLLSLHSVIHVEVVKMYPDAITPNFEYRNNTENGLQLIYTSKRNLCWLAKGMINKLGGYFGEQIMLNETKCILNGDQHCVFDLKFSEAKGIDWDNENNQTKKTKRSFFKRFFKRLFGIGG